MTTRKSWFFGFVCVPTESIRPSSNQRTKNAAKSLTFKLLPFTFEEAHRKWHFGAKKRFEANVSSESSGSSPQKDSSGRGSLLKFGEAGTERKDVRPDQRREINCAEQRGMR